MFGAIMDTVNDFTYKRKHNLLSSAESLSNIYPLVGQLVFSTLLSRGFSAWQVRPLNEANSSQGDNIFTTVSMNPCSLQIAHVGCGCVYFALRSFC